MDRNVRLPLALAGLVILLAGCGISAGGENTSPPTHSGGPVDIATDHSQYPATDTIKVTVTNHLSSAIYAYDTGASCSILTLEVLVNGSWQQSSAAPCAVGRVAMLGKILPGVAYAANISAGAIPHSKAAFPAGTYRLVLVYYSSPTPEATAAGGTTVHSAPFTIAGSGGSLSAPLATAPGGTGPAQP